MPVREPKRVFDGRRRRGATAVEFAIVGPLVFFLLLGFAVMAMGVYRYQQVAFLAREGARYASTHGAQCRVDHRLDAGDQASWTEELRDNAVLPHCSTLDTDLLTIEATWDTGDNRANAADSTGRFTSTIDNNVTVTVTYQWLPEVYSASAIDLSSTATVPMAY